MKFKKITNNYKYKIFFNKKIIIVQNKKAMRKIKFIHKINKFKNNRK